MKTLDADEILLGELIAGVKDFWEAAANLSAASFTRIEHRLIFRRMAELHERGEAIDRVSVANELMKFNELEACGGLEYLVGLDDAPEPLETMRPQGQRFYRGKVMSNDELREQLSKILVELQSFQTRILMLLEAALKRNRE